MKIVHFRYLLDWCIFYLDISKCFYVSLFTSYYSNPFFFFRWNPMMSFYAFSITFCSWTWCCSMSNEKGETFSAKLFFLRTPAGNKLLIHVSFVLFPTDSVNDRRYIKVFSCLYFSSGKHFYRLLLCKLILNFEVVFGLKKWFNFFNFLIIENYWMNCNNLLEENLHRFLILF